MTVYELAVRTKELLQDPKHWGKCWDAVEKEGFVCYCLRGAIRRVAGGEEGYTNNLEKAVFSLCREAIIERTGIALEITQWNDEYHRTHKDVLILLDEVIKKAKEATDA